MCGECAKKSDNNGIMRSRLERNYTLRMKISLDGIIPYHDDSNVEEHIRTHDNKYKYV